MASFYFYPFRRAAKIESEEAFSIMVPHKKPLKGQYALFGNMGEYPSDQLDMPPRFGQIRVINDHQATWKAGTGLVALHCCFPYQLHR